MVAAIVAIGIIAFVYFYCFGKKIKTEIRNHGTQLSIMEENINDKTNIMKKDIKKVKSTIKKNIIINDVELKQIKHRGIKIKSPLLPPLDDCVSETESELELSGTFSEEIEILQKIYGEDSENIIERMSKRY